MNGNLTVVKTNVESAVLRMHKASVFLIFTDLYRQSSEVNPRTDDSLVVVGIHADGVGLEVERVLAVLDLLQLVLMEVGPSPDPCIDHVGKSLPASNLRIEII